MSNPTKIIMVCQRGEELRAIAGAIEYAGGAFPTRIDREDVTDEYHKKHAIKVTLTFTD